MSDIDHLSLALVNQEQVLNEAVALLRESLDDTGVHVGFDARLAAFWNRLEALSDWRSRDLVVNSLEARLAEAQKDAERFAKLARMAQRQKVTIADTGVIPYRVCLNGQVLGDSLREVVDKAIEVGQQPHNSGAPRE